jgi:hypothetical protein
MKDLKKKMMVRFHVPSKEPTVPHPTRTRPATVMDLNEKPAAVKVGPYLQFDEKTGEQNLVKVKRRWVPLAWIEPFEPAKKKGEQ